MNGSPGASHFPSLSQMRRDTMKKGHVVTSPFHKLSRGGGIKLYADNPERADILKGSFNVKGSYTVGVIGGVSIAMITAASTVIVLVRAILSAIFLRVRDLLRFLVSRK